MWTSHQVDGLSTNISKSIPDFAYLSLSPLASLSSTHTLILKYIIIVKVYFQCHLTTILYFWNHLRPAPAIEARAYSFVAVIDDQNLSPFFIANISWAIKG